MNPIDLQNADPTQTEGIRNVLNLDSGHIAMDGDALLIAANRQELQYWLTVDNQRTQIEVVEPVTILVQDPPVDDAHETSLETNDNTATEQADDTNHNDENSSGETMDDMGGHDQPEHPTTRSQVLARIKKRAGTTKTSGRRTNRRRSAAERSLI